VPRAWRAILSVAAVVTGVAIVSVVAVPSTAAVASGDAPARPGTLRIDPRFGRQAVSLDGVTLLARAAGQPSGGAVQRLVARYGAWTSCATGAGFGSTFTGKWYVVWAASGVDLFTLGDPRLTTCVTDRSRGRVSFLDLRQAGSLVATPLGSFRVGQRFSTLPAQLRRALVPEGTVVYNLPLESRCRHGAPVTDSGLYADILSLQIRLASSGTGVDPAGHIAVVSSAVDPGIGC
jgi:hypothetical protein